MRVFLGASMLACEPGPRFRIHGTRGSYVKHGLDPQEAALRSGLRPSPAGWGAEPETCWGVLVAPREDGAVERRPVPTEAGDYRRFYENVRDALAGAARLEVTARDGYRTIRLLELARESSRQGRSIPCASEL
jgi:predicted dehydrogenase